MAFTGITFTIQSFMSSEEYIGVDIFFGSFAVG